MTLEEQLGKLLEDVVRRVVREELGARHGEDRYLSTAHAAELLDVEPETIAEWVRQGKLTRYQAGRGLRVSLLELRAFVKTAPPAPAEDPRRLSPEALARRDADRRRRAA